MNALQAAAAALQGTIVERLLASLVDASLKGSVILVAVWVVTRFMRRASAASRHLAWAAALGAVLLLPLISPFLPVIALPGLPSVTLPAVKFHATTRATEPTPREERHATTPPPASASQKATTPVVSSLDGPAAPSTLAPKADASGVDVAITDVGYGWAAFLPALWFTGATLIFMRLVLGTFRVSLWTRRARPVDDGGWLALTQRVAARLRITRPVILLRSEMACVPMTWGIVYPTVLLPNDADQWPAERRTIVLMHELAHVKRLDAFTQLVAQVAVGLFWFNPLVWLAARQMRTEREHACDDFVISAGARASDYAQDLLDIARSLGESSAPAAVALAMARRSEFEGRLLAILDPKTDRRSVTPARLALSTAAVLLLALPLAALKPVPSVSAASTVQAPSVPRDSAPLVGLESPAASTQRAATTHATTAVASRPAPQKQMSVQGAALLAQIAPPVAETIPFGKPQQVVVDRETLISVARAAAKMTSDYEKGQLLRTIARRYLRDDELRTVYLDAVSGMTSDYEKGLTLNALLIKDTLPPDAVAQVVQIAAKMSSDYEKANLLAKTATDYPLVDSKVRSALVSAAVSISSDYERSRVLRAIVKRPGLSTNDVVLVLDATSKISSSNDKAGVLEAISARYSLSDDRVRTAFFKAAETITSATDYRRVMTGVLNKP